MPTFTRTNTPRVPQRHLTHIASAVALLLAFQASVAQTAPAAAPPAVTFNVAALPLDQALAQFARQAGLQLAASPDLLRGLQGRAVSGTLGVPAALDELLRGSGLRGRIADGLLTIERGSQRAEAETTMPVVRVKADAVRETATGPVVGYVAKRSATGTKTDTPLVDVPQSISVITSRELDDKGVTTLTQALVQTPGVTVNPYGFDSRGLDWVLLRGFDGWYTSNFRDGLAQNVGITFLGVQTEVYGLERLEVLRGPASVLFGKGDVGGVVNRVSKVPSTDAVREIGLQVGRYDRKQVMADVGGVLDANGQWLWRVVGLGLDTGTQDEYPDGERMKQKRQYLAPSLTWRASPQTSLTLQAEVLRDDGSDDVQYVTAADGTPTNVKEGDPTYSRIKTGSDAIGYQLSHSFAGGWQLQQKMRYAHRTSDKHHILSFFDTAPNTLLRQARHDVESVDETAIDTSVQGTITTDGISHRLLFGLDVDRSRAEWQRWQDMTSSLDMSNPVYGISIAEPATQSRDKQVVSEQIGLYAQDQVRFDSHWGLTFGLRQDRVKTKLDDRMGGVQDERTDNATTGRVGLSYQVGNGWAPYVSYGESFVPVLAIDDDVLFDPSRGKQVEIGIKYMPEGKALSFTAAVFNLEKTNVVSYDPVEFLPHAIGKVRSRGLELEARAELTKQLRLTGSFTALNMKVLSSAIPEEVGNMPILTPKQTAALWLDYSLGAAVVPGVSVGGGVRYVGQRWNDAANTSSEPGYTLADAALRYDTGPWRFALNVTNLFNKEYLSGRSFGSYFRGEERNVVLTAKYRF